MSRIRGAVIDELRSTDWIPRSVRMKARHFERTVAALESRLQRSPTEEEVAAEMGMDVEDVRKFLGQLSLVNRSEEHTSELQSRQYLVCRLLLEKKKKHKR